MSADVSLAAPSLGRRMAAWLYEAFLLLAIALIASLVFSVAVDMRSGMDPRRWLLQGFLAVVFAVYFSYLWSRGQTLAMKTWRIRVESANGGAVSRSAAIRRYLFAVAGLALAGIGFLWAFLDPDRQFLHDRLAGTRLTAV